MRRPEGAAFYVSAKGLSLQLDVVKWRHAVTNLEIPRLTRKRTPPPDETFEEAAYLKALGGKAEGREP